MSCIFWTSISYRSDALATMSFLHHQRASECIGMPFVPRVQSGVEQRQPKPRRVVYRHDRAVVLPGRAGSHGQRIVRVDA